MNRYEKVDNKMKELYANTFNNMDTPDSLSRKVLTMRNTNTKKTIRTSIKVAIAVAAAAAIAVGGTVITFASRGYKGQYQTAYLNGKEVSSRFGQLNDHCWTFEVTDSGTAYSVYVYGEYTPDQDYVYITDMGDYVIASINEEPTLNLYDKIDNSPYCEYVDDSANPQIKIPVIINGEQLNTIEVDLSNDEKDGAKDGLIDDKYEFTDMDDSFIKSYTAAPNGSVILAYKGEADADEGLEMLWGLIWGEESQENIEKYAEEHYN